MTVDVLDVRIISAGYGNHPVLREIHVSLRSGDVVTILGANGAGKSTLVRAISGLIPFKGSVVHNGQEIAGWRPERIARRGIIQVPEGRGTIGALTVRENLLVGGYLRRDQAAIRTELAYVYKLFPRLGEREAQQAGSLSGGEQQMLAIGRALMGAPRILILDEPSLGLAPLLIQQIFDALRLIRGERHLGILLVEQNAVMALSISTRGHVLEDGAVALSGAGDELMRNETIIRSYLGSPYQDRA